MKKASKLTFEERVQIKTHLEHHLRPSQIARKLGRHRSTITRELKIILWTMTQSLLTFMQGMGLVSFDGLRTNLLNIPLYLIWLFVN